MREIEYKAWLKDEEKMVDVVSIDFRIEEIAYVEQCTLGNIQQTWYEFRDFNDIELLEYTGIKDKNGVKIFEGDIVKDDRERIFVIEYKFGGFNIVPINCYNDEFSWNPLGDMQTAGWLTESAEVIDNIYENKELLNE